MIVVVRTTLAYSRTVTCYILPIFVKCFKIRTYTIVTYARYRTQQSRQMKKKLEDL